MKDNNKSGFSAIEMLLVLTVVGSMLFLTLSFSNSILSQEPGQRAANQAYNYSQAVARYITTHQNLLRQNLSEGGLSNNKLATVSPQVLVNEGFIKNNLYFKNNLNQYPCTVIWYDNNQLQSFIYYRDNNDSKKLDDKQLKYGLSSMGAMIGLYQHNQVISAAKDWSMDAGFISKMFIKKGNADIFKDNNPDIYACSGNNIANPSYVVNVTSILSLKNRLPKDDTIQQYQDVLHDVDDPQSNNRMDGDLSMDNYDSEGVRKQSNVIFQMNPNCQLDPTRESTLQDYNPNIVNKPGQANISGCKNRQLAIKAAADPLDPQSGRQVMMVTGFQQGGDPEYWGGQQRPYVGEVRAASLQPTTAIAIGDPCDRREIGTMAKQMRSSDPDDINNIYVGQVICMQSPLCEKDTDGFCYMPLQNVTIESHPNDKTVTCPVGTFIDKASIVFNQINIQNKVTCVANKSMKPYPEVNCVATHPLRDDLSYTDQLNTAFQTQVPLYRTLIVPSTRWEQWCGNAVHIGCPEGKGVIPDTQDIIRSIQCTNDPSKAAVIVQVQE